MSAITKSGAYELLIVFGLAYGLFLAAASAVPWAHPLSSSRYRLLLTVAGAATVAATLGIASSAIGRVYPVDNMSGPWSVLSIMGVAGVGLAIAYSTVNLVPRAALAVAGGIGSGRWGVPAAAALATAGTVAVLSATVVAAAELKPGEVVSKSKVDSRLLLDASYSLPAPVYSVVFRTNSEGYMSLDGRGILHFKITSRGRDGLQLRTVAQDITSPRGLEIIGDRLFASTPASFPCAGIRDDCRSTGAAVTYPRDDGAVAVFDILPNGDLSGGRALVSGLPAIGFWHGINELKAGPDGMLYLSIGGSREPSGLFTDEFLRRGGSVLRIDPDSGATDEYAHGLRNVFDLTFDSAGRMYGIDNDGLTFSRFRGEEVLRIEEGLDYGFPRAGSLGDNSLRTGFPLWVMSETNGSAGIEWAPNVGLGPGLLIGSGRKLEYLPMNDLNGVPEIVQLEFGLETVLRGRSGFFSVVDATPDGRLVVGVYGFSLDSELVILTAQR